MILNRPTITVTQEHYNTVITLAVIGGLCVAWWALSAIMAGVRWLNGEAPTWQKIMAVAGTVVALSVAWNIYTRYECPRA
jgi:membrane protein implicated in regulation of membrane protease activity